jgi:glycosyltransferase involved in cell wall biosynthesis
VRVLEIVASIDNPSHGPSYSVPRLAEAVARAGADVELLTVGRGQGPVPSGAESPVLHRAYAHDLASVPRIHHLRLSRALASALRSEADDKADVLHTHGLWLAPNIYPATAARSAGKAFVISPRGMLGKEAMRFSSLQKTLVWKLAQKKAMAGAAFIHATSEGECDEVRAMGLAIPVVVIPNGVDVPALQSRPKGWERVALSLGRIHPKKGLDRLIRAWDLAGKATADWRLKIVGPDEAGHVAELQALSAARGLTNVEIFGPLYGEEKMKAYRHASLFVLPTLNENFALTVAESLAAGTPVISTKGAPWSGLETEGCGWWIDHGEAAMAAALTTALGLPRAELDRMGERGRDWMIRDFGWDHIGRRMLAAYTWAVTGGEPPAEARL